MCGICFIYHQQGNKNSRRARNTNLTQDSAALETAIQRMVKALYHRGPDDQNYVIRNNVALGHTRLSIVDIRGGSQPMVSSDGRYAIIYNGEIYNYQELRAELEEQGYVFNTDSDTEVILNLFLRDEALCVHSLRGMFAFAIHDLRSNELFVARDRLGIKPLVYHWDGETFIGGSEIKALFASRLVEPQFNYQSLRNFFSYQFNVQPHTIFQGIYELPAGHTVTLTPGAKPQIHRYWDLQFPREGEYDNLDEDQWTEEFDSVLNDAVQSHMIGEVPIGSYLSGGVDSSTTTYLLQHYYPADVRAFTIRFSNKANDEYPITSKIAEHIGVDLHDVFMDDEQSGDYLKVLVDALYAVEQPQRMALDIPLLMLSKLVRENKYKVVYTGEGADEILGGYDCYRQDYIRQWGNQQQSQQARLNYYLHEFSNDFANEFLQLFARLHEDSLQQQTIKRFGCYPAWHDFWHILDDGTEGLFSDDFLHQSDDHQQQMTQLIQAVKPQLQGLHPLNQSLYLESKTRLPGWILWRADRLAMANGVEARVPFLDHRLVELAAQVPPVLKLNGLDEKYILRKIMMPKLAEHPQQFKKRAFYTPIREWFFTRANAGYLQSYMSEIKITDAGLFNPHTVNAKLEELLSLPSPNNPDEYYRIMKLEWILFLVLSIQILHELFINKTARCFADP